MLETRYRVVPIGAADRASLAQGRLLLMAHALPQTAEALVDLDRWVRDGGGCFYWQIPSSTGRASGRWATNFARRHRSLIRDCLLTGA
ncbi:hypothetical protein H9L15_03005 [Sphingomonas daechungensis]|uniref:Alpha/beta hydrolase n=1 Tax=Sphingomonas daechungensis TaxID=1176646 RepID=A0ABX6T1P4_9SPHN|nr:hypothetical protein [Sphingomonas daechungensis]QNP43675.1 hypothetical protein H9L15_03005 [Sphingomonas daechungensis]